MSDSGSSGDFFAGFVFGAFVGAALALLLTPYPGDELRHQLRDKGIELKERASDLDLDNIKTKGQHLLEEQRARVHDAIEEGKAAASRRKEELLEQLEGRTGESSIELKEADA